MYVYLSSDRVSGLRPSYPTWALLAACAMYPAPLSAIFARFSHFPVPQLVSAFIFHSFGLQELVAENLV